MTVVRPTTQQKNFGVRNTPIFSGPTDKEIAELQVKKASLYNDIEAAIKEINFLSSTKSAITKKIQEEQAVYDSMVIRPHAELAAELEQKKIAHQENLQNLNRKLELVIIEIEKQTKVLDNIYSRITEATANFEKKQMEFKKISSNFQTTLAAVKGKTQEAQIELKNILKQNDQAKKEIEEAKKNIIAEQIKQNIYAASLERKAQDLAIWQKRLDPLFKNKYPQGEMKFI
jgi:hypothetical protein